MACAKLSLLFPTIPLGSTLVSLQWHQLLDAVGETRRSHCAGQVSSAEEKTGGEGMPVTQKSGTNAYIRTGIKAETESDV